MYRILILTLLSLSITFVKANANLPPCRDCDAESDACYDQADADFDTCIEDAEDVYQTTLAAIEEETQNLINSSCGEDDGGLFYSGCVYSWLTASGPAIAIAFGINQIDRSQCRIDRNWDKSICDANYLLCVADVAGARSNCECE